MFAGIEPIGGMLGVSRPPAESEIPERTEDQELAMFEQIKAMLTGNES